MKNKPPLILMEEMIMLLVFALAAALCLQAFVKSDSLSKRSEARDRALSLCRNAAEVVRAADGDFEKAARQLELELGQNNTMYRYYDENWNPLPGEDGAYVLRIQGIRNVFPGLGKAFVSVSKAEDEQDILFELEIAWQEVIGDAA